MEDGSGITAVRRPARAARAVRVARVTADGAPVVVGRNQNLVDSGWNKPKPSSGWKGGGRPCYFKASSVNATEVVNGMSLYK